MPERVAGPVACAVLDDYQEAARRFGDWDALGDRIRLTVHSEHFAGEDALVAAIDGAQVVVAMRERTPFPASTLARLPNLKLLVTTGRSNAVIDLAAARALGIAVSATGTWPTGTAELTWALILAHARRVPLEWQNLRAGGPWQTGVGRDLAGRTLGVLGLGAIGKQVARIGKAFGMKVQAWSTNLATPTCEAEGVAHAGSLDTLLSSSDVVTVHLALGDRSRGMLGAAQLRRMKPTGLLVNTARSPIVDEAALVAALQQGWIAGAAIDVFDREPLPLDHPFRRLDQVLATPHVGYVTEDTYSVYFRDVVEDIRAWLDGAPIRLLEAA